MTLAQKALGLLSEPGVYLMKDKDEKIIYVGKAKNLKRRVYSYFSAQNKHSEKTAAMLAHVKDFDIIVAKTELEALLLENNLIKKNMPKYNILLKDDKGYPYIKISKGDYPQLQLARKIAQDGAEYFGPFYGSRSAKSIIEAANKAYMLPICNNPCPKQSRRPCLNYRIKRCVGPCGGNISPLEYAALIDAAREFLKGDIAAVIEDTRQRMEQASEAMEFERAAVLRDRMKAITSILEKQRVASDLSVSGDYISVLTAGEYCAIVILSVDKGIMKGKNCYIADKNKIDDESSFAGEYIKRFYEQNPSVIPHRIVVQPLPEDREIISIYLAQLCGKSVQIIKPLKTVDKQIIDMAQSNAKEEIVQKQGRTQSHQRLLFELGNVLGLPEINMIEVYDISHTAGSDVVCGMAVYGTQGYMKSKYKRFKIPEEIAGDDCACLYDAALRRFKRYNDGDESFTPLPDFIFADGALPQLLAIKRAAEQCGIDIPVFGLKKDRNHKTKSLIFEDGCEFMLYKYPQIYPLCGRLQEEAHRFAIEYHSAAAKKRSLTSMFTEIEGVGKARAVALIGHFGTLGALKKASAQEIAQVKGISKTTAESIWKYISENLT